MPRKPRQSVAATIMVGFRATPAELARIDAVCAPLTRSDWLRAAVEVALDAATVSQYSKSEPRG